MSLKNLSTAELEEKFENFLFNIDDYLENIIEKADNQGYIFDYSLESLNDLEKYLIENKTKATDDDVNDLAAYFGEVVRKNIGGIWKCSLDLKNNSLYYGKPVIIEYTNPKDLELSPFDCILNYIAEPEPNYFITIIENDLNDEPLNLDDIPTEE